MNEALIIIAKANLAIIFILSSLLFMPLFKNKFINTFSIKNCTKIIAIIISGITIGAITGSIIDGSQGSLFGGLIGGVAGVWLDIVRLRVISKLRDVSHHDQNNSGDIE